jgi:TPR repeat protein
MGDPRPPRLAGLSGAGQNESMKRTLLFALALAVIPIGVDAQAPDLEETRARAEQGYASAQYNLGRMYANGDGVPEDDAEAVRWYRLAAEQGKEWVGVGRSAAALARFRVEPHPGWRSRPTTTEENSC